MPVERKSSIGVSSVAAGSSITAEGPIRGWRKCILTLRWTSVIPAPKVYSAADSVVGTAVMRVLSEASCDSPGMPRFCASVDRRVGIANPPPQRDQHGLGRIDHRPSADREQVIRIGLARRCRAGDHGFARRVGADRGELPDTAIAERGSHFPYKPALRQRSRGGKKHPLCADTVHLGANRRGGRRPVYHPFLRRPFKRARQHFTPVRGQV
jgi:hypothetical protein